jgi:hypothetical protein
MRVIGQEIENLRRALELLARLSPHVPAKYSLSSVLLIWPFALSLEPKACFTVIARLCMTCLKSSSQWIGQSLFQRFSFFA